MTRQCIDCEHEFDVPETMPDTNMCFPCWSEDVDGCFPPSSISATTIVVVLVAIIGVIGYAIWKAVEKM